MHRIFYISTARQPIDEPLCQDILSSSRLNNDRDGITGLLIAGRQRFLQLLEGEEQAVRRTYDRIKRDPRHFACVILQQGESAGRLLPLWSMGFERAEETTNGLSDAQIAASLIGQVADANVRAQFEGFIALHWRDARAA